MRGGSCAGSARAHPHSEQRTPNPSERSGLRRTRNANKAGATWSIREVLCPEGRVEPAQPSRRPRALAAAGLRWATPCTGPGDSPSPPARTHPGQCATCPTLILGVRHSVLSWREGAHLRGCAFMGIILCHPHSPPARGHGWALHAFQAELVTRPRRLHSLEVAGPGSELKTRLPQRWVKGWLVPKPLPVLPVDAEMLRVPVPGPGLGLGPPWTNQENPNDYNRH